MQKYKSNIITTTGLAQRNVSVRVLDDNGALATLYADRYGQTPIANPQVTAVDGTFAFYAANGRYSLQTTINGVTYTDQDVVLAADPDDMLVAGPIADAVNSATANVLASANTAAAAAQASQNAADASRGAAAASESNAAGSASAAEGSAATASGAAGAASASEVNANASANAAATSAGNAATSESNALASKNAAAAAAANAATYAQGYANGGAYAAGITLSDRFTFVAKDNELYRLADAVALPYTTTGDWASESNKFVSIGDRNLRQNLADASPAAGAALVAFQQGGVASVTRNVLAKLRETISFADFGAVGDGVTDNSAFLANCPATDLLVPPGTYLVNSNTTIAANLRFAAGAILKPASGVTITLSAPFTAPLSQIFDLSAGGSIGLPNGLAAVYPQWWGAKGDGATDDRPPFEAMLNSLASMAGAALPKALIPPTQNGYLINSYSSNSALATAQYQVLPIMSNLHFVVEAGATILIGSFFSGKKFRLFSGYNATTTGGLTVVANCVFEGPGSIDFNGSVNQMGASYQAPRDGIDFAYCSNCAVKGLTFKNGAISNAITAGTYTLGDGCRIEDCDFLNLVQSDTGSTDHSSIYSTAAHTYVTNCKFILSTVQGARVAAAVELHNSYSAWRGGSVQGYLRGAFAACVAAEQTSVTDLLFEGIDYNGRGALVFTNIDTSTNTLSNLTVQNNRINCTQGSGDPPTENVQQGIVADGLGLGTTNKVMIQGNTVAFLNTVIAGSDSVVQVASKWNDVVIQGNYAWGPQIGVQVSGASTSITDWTISNNTFLAVLYSAFTSYISIGGVNVTQLAINDNVFNLSGTIDTPINLSASGTYTYCSIKDNIFTTSLPTTKDFTAPSGFVGNTSNHAKYNVYNTSLVYPTMGAALATSANLTGLGANDARNGSTYLFKGTWPSGAVVSPAGHGNSSSTVYFACINVSGTTFSTVTISGALEVTL